MQVRPFHSSLLERFRYQGAEAMGILIRLCLHPLKRSRQILLGRSRLGWAAYRVGARFAAVLRGIDADGPIVRALGSGSGAEAGWLVRLRGWWGCIRDRGQ